MQSGTSNVVLKASLDATSPPAFVSAVNVTLFEPANSGTFSSTRKRTPFTVMRGDRSPSGRTLAPSFLVITMSGLSPSLHMLSAEPLNLSKAAAALGRNSWIARSVDLYEVVPTPIAPSPTAANAVPTSAFFNLSTVFVCTLRIVSLVLSYAVNLYKYIVNQHF